MYSIRHLLVIGFAAFTAAFEESPAIWVPSLAIDAGSVLSAKESEMKDRQWSCNHNADDFGALQCRHRHRSGHSVTSSHKALGRPAKLSFVPSRFLGEEEAEEAVETVVRPVEPRGETTQWRE
ncbi:hypothetical protein EDB80DRAFT_692519 [Ilyonectria destructans]|nr:hypothetical protein EDB80DRAFT_692519 [Ilyonectria destructans]